MSIIDINLIPNRWLFWNILFRLIYQETRLKSIIVNENAYTWDDNDFFVDEYKEGEKNRKLPDDAKVSFDVEIRSFQDADFWKYEFEDWNHEYESEETKNILFKINSDTKFVSSKEVQIINPKGENADVRGSDFIDYKIPMEERISLGKEFSLRTLVETAYMVKSHHFENHYELFTGIDSINEKENLVEIFLDFNHGS